MDFQCQNGRPWRAKTRILHYTCRNLRGFARSWKLMKNVCQKSSLIIQYRSRRRPRMILYDFRTCLGAPISCIFWITKKAATNSNKSVCVPKVSKYLEKQGQRKRGRSLVLSKGSYIFLYIYIYLFIYLFVYLSLSLFLSLFLFFPLFLSLSLSVSINMNKLV